jgi:hypothetical protein
LNLILKQQKMSSKFWSQAYLMEMTTFKKWLLSLRHWALFQHQMKVYHQSLWALILLQTFFWSQFHRVKFQTLKALKISWSPWSMKLDTLRNISKKFSLLYMRMHNLMRISWQVRFNIKRMNLVLVHLLLRDS